MKQTAEEAKALLAEKLFIKDFRIFRMTTTWINGHDKIEFFVKERRKLFGWKWVKRRGQYGRRVRLLRFDSEFEARQWIERNYPPKLKMEEVRL
jgi:hypothetical protein